MFYYTKCRTKGGGNATIVMKRTLLTIAVAFALFGLVGTAGATTAEAPQSDDVMIQTPYDDQPQTESMSATPFDVGTQNNHDDQPQTNSISASPLDVSIQTPRDEQPQTE